MERVADPIPELAAIGATEPRRLGFGQFGEVFECNYDGKKVACKVCAEGCFLND